MTDDVQEVDKDAELFQWTLEDVAGLFRVEERTVARWAKKWPTALPSIRTPGNRRRFRESDVHALYAISQEGTPLELGVVEPVRRQVPEPVRTVIAPQSPNNGKWTSRTRGDDHFGLNGEEL